MFSPILRLCLLFPFHSLGRMVRLTTSHCSPPGWVLASLARGSGKGALCLLPRAAGPQPPGSPLQKPGLQRWAAGQNGRSLPGAGVAFGRGSTPRVIDFNGSASCLSSSGASASLNSILITLLAQGGGESIARVNNQVSATGMIRFPFAWLLFNRDKHCRGSRCASSLGYSLMR